MQGSVASTMSSPSMTAKGSSSDEVPRLEDRVPEAERGLLPDVGDRDQVRDLAHLAEQVVFAPLLEHPLELEGSVEVVLDRVLAAAGDDDDPLDPGGAGLLDDVLDQRPVDQRQHLLGLRLGGRQESGAEARGGEDGDADGGHGGESYSIELDVSGFKFREGRIGASAGT